MNVIYWSDYACPFCYIGETILRKAFTNLHTNEKLELVMKSFELNPTASREVVSSTPERFRKEIRHDHSAGVRKNRGNL